VRRAKTSGARGGPAVVVAAVPVASGRASDGGLTERLGVRDQQRLAMIVSNHHTNSKHIDDNRGQHERVKIW